MKNKKIISVVGARPNFIKIAPVLLQLRKYKKINSLLVHTGQHYDKEMSKVFFKDLRLPKPDIYLGVGSCTHSEQIARMMIKLEDVFIREKPDLCIVVGDVNSTLAGALVAAKLSVPIAHVESGLRSFDRSMPEEINRVITDSLSRFLFTPSMDANENLYNEGLSKENIYFVGNVMIDTLLRFKGIISKNNMIFNRLKLDKKKFVLATLHRPSNVDNIEDIKKIIISLYKIEKKFKIVFPVHPRTMFYIKKFGIEKELSQKKNILVINPLGYIDFLTLLAGALFVITDSGGIQEETTVLGIPCLTVRDNTERPVTVDEGTNLIVGTKPYNLIRESNKILSGITKKGCVPKFWDGDAGIRIVKVIRRYLGE